MPPASVGPPQSSARRTSSAGPPRGLPVLLWRGQSPHLLLALSGLLLAAGAQRCSRTSCAGTTVMG
jgi:hypothetical protein